MPEAVMIKKTVLPTRFQSFMNKRLIGVMANLAAIFLQAMLVFLIFSLLLAHTPLEENNIRTVAVSTAMAVPITGCLTGVAWHKKLLLKKGFASTNKEARSDIMKNVLISLLIYFSVIMFF